MKRFLPANCFYRNIVAAILLLACYTGSRAQWIEKNNGLWGGSIKAFAENSNYLFAGTEGGGVFRSPDGGASWVAVNKGLTPYGITSLACIGNTVFAGTNVGLFSSTNNGDTWSYNSGLPNENNVYALAVLGTNIFVSINYSNPIPFGVYRSTNNGVSWTAINTGLDFSNFQGVISLFVSGGNLFAGSTGNGAFLSTNNGDSWTAIKTGLPSTTIWDFVVKGNKLFAATNSGVFVSSNNGSDWSSIGNLGNQTLALATDGSRIIAGTNTGVFVSNNDGTSWTSTNDFPFNTFTYDVFMSSNSLFAGTLGKGIFRSTNGGVNWIVSNSGLTSLSISSLVFKGTKLFASTNNGVYVSSDNGSNWNATSTSAFANNNLSISSIATLGNNIFAGTAFGIYVSTDDGANWVDTNNNLPTGNSRGVNSILVSGSSIYLGTSGGTFISASNGASWTAFNSGLSSTNVASLFLVDGSIYARTGDGKIFVSKNGAAWSLVDTTPIGNVRSFAVSPSNFYAGNDFFTNFYISDNKILNWKKIDVTTGLTNKPVFSSAVNLDKVFLGKADGVSFSVDQEKNWSNGSEGLPNGGNFSIVTMTTNTTSLFAGTSAGVWSRPLSEFKACIKPIKPFVTVSLSSGMATLTSTASTGNQWFLNNTAIVGATGTSYIASAEGTYKVQVTINNCLSDFSLDIPVVITGDLNGTNAFINIYPNPANKILFITSLEPETNQCTVVDALGRSIEMNLEKVDEQHSLNTENLIDGLYLLRVKHSNSVKQLRFLKRD